MEWLNYQHLMYFWTVAKEGTVVAASEKLHLAQPTISAQIKSLENAIGHDLFTRRGRRLQLTETGKTVFRYADEIFSLGKQLHETLEGVSQLDNIKFQVGIADVVPKLVAYNLLEPAFRSENNYHVICQEGKSNELIAKLAIHELDLVITDAPVSPDVSVRAFNHLLGECTATVFSTPDLAPKLKRKFPESLDGMPFILPTSNTVLRKSIDYWFEKNNIHPKIVGEFEDSALIKVFAQAGTGLFIGPSVIENEIETQYDLKLVGRVKSIREKFYAISIDRRFKHPASISITESARKEMFN